jgi:SOS-response transcriptional repressor LexA/DNA-binding Xre family transcriptional regulator
MNTIGNNILRLLNSKGLCASDLAKKSLLSKSSISLIINGKFIPRKRTLSSIAAALGCSVADLERGNDIAVATGELSIAADHIYKPSRPRAPIQPDDDGRRPTDMAVRDDDDRPVVTVAHGRMLHAAGPSGLRTDIPGPPSVPILGCAAAAGFEPAVEPLDDFMVGQADDRATFNYRLIKPNYFALRVEGESMLPKYPPDTLLLVGAGEFPSRGQVVVARLADHGEVVCKRYYRKSNVITLTSLNPEGQSFEIDLKTQPGRVIWMYPVLQAIVTEGAGE